MKIGLLTDSDVFSGTERHMLDLGTGLRTLGASPTLICPVAGELANRGRAMGIPVMGLEKGSTFSLNAIRTLRRCFETATFEIIHAHNGRTKLLTALARSGNSRGILVTTQHFLSPAQAQRRGPLRIAGKVIHRLADRKVSRVIAISQAVADTLIARGEADWQKIRVVLNGIGDPKEPALIPVSEVRARYGISPETPLVVCLARLDAEKNVDLLIDAMAIVQCQNPHIRCIIGGRGAQENNLRKRLEVTGASLTTELVGFVEDSLSLLRAADLFVLPSRAEPFGLAIVEAMALGKPVISTRAGGPAEIIRDGTTGYLISPGDTISLANAIVSVVCNPAAAKAMGLAGRADYQARFTSTRMAEEVMEVYRHCLSSDGTNVWRR